jgi:RecA-family ATPase
VRWLWPGRIPLGKITVVDGDPGLGKSLLGLDLIACVTTGQALPDGADGLAGGAVLITNEDDLADTIVPRLLAAGADLTRVKLIRARRLVDAQTGKVRRVGFQLPRDVRHLRRTFARLEARLLVLDPLMGFLSGKTNSWRDQDARAALDPLVRLAQERGVAVVGLRHLNKATGTNALYRGTGSTAWGAVARSVLLVAPDPEQPESHRVLASSKSNLGPPMPSLRYAVVADAAPDGADGSGADGSGHAPARPRIEWLGVAAYRANQLLAEQGASTVGDSGGRQTPRAAARELLQRELASGPRPVAEVKA